MTEPNFVLHIRQSSGGGGADSVIYNSIKHALGSEFQFVVVCLRKKNVNLSLWSSRFAAHAFAYFELPGSLPVFHPLQFWRLLRVSRKYPFQVIHSHDPKSNFYAFLLKLFMPRLKLVSTLHGWTQKGKKGKLYSVLDRLVLTRFDRIIAVSRSLEKRILRGRNRNVSLIQNAVDLDVWHSNGHFSMKCTNPFKIGFVGRLSPEKGPDVFIEAARILAGHSAMFEFYIAGQGTLRNQLQDQAYKNDLGDKIHFLGFLGQEELKEFYQSLNVLLVTSHTEGLPMTILEAQAMNVPVVATDVGGVGEIIEHGINGLLEKDNNAEGLAQKVLFLWRNPTAANEFAVKARTVICDHFSILKNARKITELYKDVILER